MSIALSVGAAMLVAGVGGASGRVQASGALR